MDYRKLTSKLLAHEPKRSEAFHQGMAAVLQNRVDESSVSSPYQPGTAEDDAFFAGRMRAHSEFRNLLIEANGNRQAVIDRLEQFVGEERRVA